MNPESECLWQVIFLYGLKRQYQDWRDCQAKDVLLFLSSLEITNPAGWVRPVQNCTLVLLLEAISFIAGTCPYCALLAS